MKITPGIRFGRFLLWFFRPLIYFLLPFKFIDKEIIRSINEPMIVCCNHISAFDPVFILLASKKPVYFMGKEELFKNKLVAYMLQHWFGVFAVHRGQKDASAVTTSLEILEDGGMLGIFPEGTRSKDGTLGAAKSGAALIAAKTKAPILTCALIPSGKKVKFFRKTTLVIGEVLTNSDLRLDLDRPDLRYASRAIMSSIAGLIEVNKT